MLWDDWIKAEERLTDSLFDSSSVPVWFLKKLVFIRFSMHCYPTSPFHCPTSRKCLPHHFSALMMHCLLYFCLIWNIESFERLFICRFCIYLKWIFLKSPTSEKSFKNALCPIVYYLCISLLHHICIAVNFVLLHWLNCFSFFAEGASHRVHQGTGKLCQAGWWIPGTYYLCSLPLSFQHTGLLSGGDQGLFEFLSHICPVVPPNAFVLPFKMTY